MVNESYVSEVAMLLERLQDLVRHARRVPWTGKILVEERELTTLTTQIQHAMPEEVRHAHFVLSERQRILNEAKEEADAVKASGLMERDRLTDASEVAEASRQKADQMVEQAKTLAQEIHQGSRQYADEVLASLEGQLNQLLKAVKRDRAELNV
jgi:cell division septum initiation protein DivIVA